MKIFKKAAVLLLMLNTGWLYAQQDLAVKTVPAEQQKRLDLMKLKGVDASLTILPVKLMNQHWDRVSEVVGAILEEKGIKNIEVGTSIFIYEERASVKAIADSLKSFLLKNPATTDYILYAEMNGDNNPPPIDELFGLVVDNKGELVWSDFLNSNDKVFTDVDDPDPMGYSVLLTERLAPYFGLNEETARNAKPGKMAAKMRERSGLPPEEEMIGMHEREKALQSGLKESQLVVFPLRVMRQSDDYATGELVKLVNEGGLSKALISKNPLLLKPSVQDPNEMKALWDMAKQFRDYLKTNPQEGDYFLYGDYAFTPDNWQAGYVHFVICDRNGEWVVADLQNSEQTDYYNVKPVSVEDCNKILFNRLVNYTKLKVVDIIRETIESKGISAANKKFKEVSGNDEYLISEMEMNMLGYDYLNNKKYDEAIAVFRMNVEAFPDSFNTYDSLGEAYAAKGDKKAAIVNYEMSVKLNPGNQNGIQMLEKLKSK